MIAIDRERQAWLFLGWFDPDKKKPVRQKLAEAIERHVEKCGAAPTLCVTNPADAVALRDEATAAYPDPPDLPVEPAAFVPRHTFYVGVRDGEARR